MEPVPAHPPDSSEPAAPKQRKPPRGRPFTKGTSGNPGGRKRTDPSLKEALEAAGPDAVKRLHDIVTGAAKASAHVQVQAAKVILDKLVANAVPATDAKNDDDKAKLEALANLLKPKA